MFYMTVANDYYYKELPDIVLRYPDRHTDKLRLPETLLNWDEDGLGEREDAEECGVMFAEDSEEEEEA